MSRAQQLKSGDISLGLAHEWICAFGRQGGTATMLQQGIEDAAVMQRLVAAFQSECDVPTRALLAAAERGVECKNGVYRFFDPGISLVSLQDLVLVWQKRLLRRLGLVARCDWARYEDAPQERRLRIPVKGSFCKTQQDQVKLLDADENVASTRSVATFLVINALVTGERLLPDMWVRCGNEDDYGSGIVVGFFGADGFKVDTCRDDVRTTRIGLAASRTDSPSS